MGICESTSGVCNPIIKRSFALLFIFHKAEDLERTITNRNSRTADVYSTNVPSEVLRSLIQSFEWLCGKASIGNHSHT